MKAEIPVKNVTENRAWIKCLGESVPGGKVNPTTVTCQPARFTGGGSCSYMPFTPVFGMPSTTGAQKRIECNHG
jgi:hypothetical protein